MEQFPLYTKALAIVQQNPLADDAEAQIEAIEKQAKGFEKFMIGQLQGTIWQVRQVDPDIQKKYF
ncbi:hypothetical protein RCS94_05000 [Orbaceae bacterium ac157xtp]